MSDYLALGPVMLDVESIELTQSDKERLAHPKVGGVILFARNFQDREQVARLISDIKSIRQTELLVAVDQEGGRVQRFSQGFTKLPAASQFGERWNEDKHRAPIEAYQSAKTMAQELLDVGVDISFAPVFDVCSAQSDVIGGRSFHANPEVATELLGAYIDGMHVAGMATTAKHFPGHGGVEGDSHHCLPSDSRTLKEVRAHDLLPYKELINEIDAVMSAHVAFVNCDENIPTYSSFWLQSVLRQELGFEGVIFSDDLAMQGAIDAQSNRQDASPSTLPNIVHSASKALEAGCDMVLVCNRPDLADQLLDGLDADTCEKRSAKISRLLARPR